MLLRVLCLYVFIFVAAESGWAQDRIKSSVSLHASQLRASFGSEIMIGLMFTMPDGWHTYASVPGDSGMPPDIRLYDKSNVRASAWQFPPHQTFSNEAGTTYGYEGNVMLLSTIRIPESAEDTLDLMAGVMWLICKDICLPFQDRVMLSINVGDEAIDNPEWPELMARGGWVATEIGPVDEIPFDTGKE